MPSHPRQYGRQQGQLDHGYEAPTPSIVVRCQLAIWMATTSGQCRAPPPNCIMVSQPASYCISAHTVLKCSHCPLVRHERWSTGLPGREGSFHSDRAGPGDSVGCWWWAPAEEEEC